MVEREKIGMPVEDFMEQFAKQPFELVDGEILKMAPNKKRHSKLSKRVYDQILFYLADHNLGEVFFESTYILEDKPNWVEVSRVPDVMFYERTRYDTYEEQEQESDEKPFILVPDLAVEVVSPTDKYSDVQRKVAAYLRDGVRLLWIIDPQNATVTVYEGSETPTVLRSGDTLTGGDVLPDFEIAVDVVFG